LRTQRFSLTVFVWSRRGLPPAEAYGDCGQVADSIFTIALFRLLSIDKGESARKSVHDTKKNFDALSGQGI
jgi:hypothetical protein